MPVAVFILKNDPIPSVPRGWTPQARSPSTSNKVVDSAFPAADLSDATISRRPQRPGRPRASTRRAPQRGPSAGRSQ